MWARLAVFLEVHAEAEERYFYPRLLKLGKGNPDGDVDDEVEDAIKDHNEIRDAVRAAGAARGRAATSGGPRSWEARKANDDHMAEEEREDLAGLPPPRRPADPARHRGAVPAPTRPSTATGVPIRDKDPEEYVRQFG